MNFGICHLIVVDNSISFKGLFHFMAEYLNLKVDILAKHNYKDLSIKRLYRFLNKVVTIAANDCENLYIFVPVDITAVCTLDITPIDGTYIIYSVLTIGRELRFFIGMQISALPSYSYNKGQYYLVYVKLKKYSRHLKNTYRGSSFYTRRSY